MRERQWNLSKRWCSRLFWAFRITNRVHIKLIWPQDAFKLFSVWLSSRSCFSTHPVSMFSQFTWTKSTQTLTCSPNTAVSLLFVHVSLFFCVPSTSLSSAGKTFTASLFFIDCLLCSIMLPWKVHWLSFGLSTFSVYGHAVFSTQAFIVLYL